MQNIKPFTLVKVAIDKEILKKHYENLKAERIYLFLDTIKNMTGHCMVFDMKTERIHGPFHCENFRECTPEEV